MAIDRDTCEACSELQSTSLEFVTDGITEEMCDSLKKNYGLNQNLTNIHDNCQDMNTMLQCLIGKLEDELPKYSYCDWKGYMKNVLFNNKMLFQTLICSDCGQWYEINLLWAETEKLWRETEKLWAETDKLWDETAKLWNETYKIWAEINKMWEYIYALEQRIISLEGRVTSIEGDIVTIFSRLSSIDTSISTINGQITTINNRLSSIDASIIDIYNRLEGIQLFLSQSFTALTYGTDFTYQTFNGFEFPNGAPSVSVIESDYNVIIRWGTGATSTVYNYLRTTLTNDFVLRHGTDVLEERGSWVLNINFLGNYAYINTLTPLSTATSATGSNIWNLSPSSQRGNWTVYCNISRNVVYNGTTYRFLWSGVSIADGYNNQLNTERTLNDQSNGLNNSYETVMALRI